MSRKTIMVFVLATGIVAAALVFDGVSYRHAGNNSQAMLQNRGTTTRPADGSENSSNAEPAAASPATESGQSAEPDATSQAQTNGTPTAAAALPIVVPAGTTLTVRLGEQLGSRISAIGQSFSATLDRDVVVDGQTVIPAGASVTGKVVFARHVGVLAGEASLQLKLTSINTNNADLDVVTSVRSFGHEIKGKNKVGRFVKGLLKRGTVGCQLTVSYQMCSDLIVRAGGGEREVLLANQSAYSFTLRRPLQIQ
ncbi:MAG: hypothetical protein ABSD76_15565 [Terriglobales bacterium]|jgi:hypothetical protein